MKKTIIISAIALGFAFSTSNATTTIETSQPINLVKTNASVSPFCMAIMKGDFETVRKLIEFGADVNSASNGMTPAMFAARYNRVDILELLVKHGAVLKTKSVKGLTAMDYAKLSHAEDAIAYLKSIS